MRKFIPGVFWVTVFGLCSALASAEPVTRAWNGTIHTVFDDTGGGAFAGATAGDLMTLDFTYDTDPAGADQFCEENGFECDWLFTGAPYEGNITDGVTTVHGTESAPTVQNDAPLEDGDAGLVNMLVGADIAAENAPVDTWGVDTVSDGATFDEEDNLLGGMEFEVFFLTLDTSLYADLSYQPVAPKPGTTELAGFFIEETDEAGAILFSAIGLLHVFVDIRPDHWAFTFIETLAKTGITSGCGNDSYCPDDSVTRAQMAVFLERGIHGSGFSPPAATGNVFLDVASNSFAASFIEQFSMDGITSGCGGNNYCPNDAVTRAQMAVFLLRAKHGAGYTPPAATGVFADVPLGSFGVDWVEQLAAEGITSGCGNGNYCPDATVTRAQMAVFLVRAFDL